MLTINQLVQQLQLQNRLNSIVNADWLNAGYRWSDAMMVEGVEAFDHFGWKWWKKTGVPDWAQVNIELVDIWHFYLSAMLEQHRGDIHDAAASIRFTVREAPHLYSIGDGTIDLNQADFRQTLRVFVASAALGSPSLAVFARLRGLSTMSWDGLHQVYIGKNVLNIFRQAHGYKEGTYVKEWFGKEDNVALEQLMAHEPDSTPAQLLNQLEQLYTEVLRVAAGGEPPKISGYVRVVA